MAVLAESDWYRRLREPAAAAAPVFLPLDAVWVDQYLDDAGMSPSMPDQGDIPADAGPSRRLVDDLARPPVRWLQPATDAHALVGARACVMTPDGPVWDQRILGDPRREIWSETFNFSRGVDSLNEPVVGTVLPVCAESAYYAWSQTGQAPRFALHATRFVWLE